MNDLTVYTHKELGGIRALEIDGQPWFVGKDVAGILGYGNENKDSRSLNNAVNDHVDAEDKGVTKMDTPGGKQNVVVINESGLYALIFGSKLPKAKQFKRWVTSEVLPAIRKTGGYVCNNDLEHLINVVVGQTTAAVMAGLPAVVEEAVKAMMNVTPRNEENFKLNTIDWEEAAFWENVLSEWREYRRKFANKDTADKQFVKEFNEKNPGLKIGQRTLYRKWKAFNEKGGYALIDKRGRHGNHRRKTVTEVTLKIEVDEQ